MSHISVTEKYSDVLTYALRIHDIMMLFISFLRLVVSVDHVHASMISLHCRLFYRFILNEMRSDNSNIAKYFL